VIGSFASRARSWSFASRARSWDEIEALPQPLRWTVQRTIFHLLDEPVPTLADPSPPP